MKTKNSPVKLNNRRISAAKRLEDRLLNDKTLSQEKIALIKAELVNLAGKITTSIVAKARRTKKSRQTKITTYV